MIIDCHGHYTTAPELHNQWRIDQLAAFAAGQPSPDYPEIPDDVIRESIEGNQLKLITERGSDLTIFSPRASAMGHHEGDQRISLEWTVACNNLIKRVVDLFPETFVGVAQLPQSPGADLTASIAELERTVNELGFIGINLNPDPSGGKWETVPLTDKYWYPLYEKMVELDVPAMVHVSASCNPNFHATGAHYMNADTTAFMQLLQGDLFADFPTLRLIIPHGGGAVPYHWGRYRGLADMLKQPDLEHPPDGERVLRHLRLPPARHRSAREGDREQEHPVRLGDDRGGARDRPDDRALLRRHPPLHRRRRRSATRERASIFSANARAVFPRLEKRLAEQGR